MVENFPIVNEKLRNKNLKKEGMPQHAPEQSLQF